MRKCLFSGITGLFMWIGLLPVSEGVYIAEAGYLKNLPKTCLPIKGRMSDNRSNACRCPPKQLCPKNEKEWTEAKILPPYIANVCCQRPKKNQDACSVIEHVSGPTQCPGLVELAPMQAHFCTEYVAKSVAGAQNPDDKDYDPNREENIKQKTWQQAADEYNQCIAGRCASELGLLLNAMRKKSERYSAINLKRHFKGKRELSGFARCELSCRGQAANILRVSLTNQEQALKEAIMTPKYANPGVFVHNSFSKGARQLKRLTTSDGSPIPKWIAKRDKDDPNHFLFSPINKDKSPGDFLASALDGALTCNRIITPTICLSYTANNGSCSSCLSPDMAVLMGDGNSKAIKEIRKDDVVKSAYGKMARVKEVVIKDWPMLTLYSINGGKLKLTADHPVMTTTGWRAINYAQGSDEDMKKYGLHHVPKLKVGHVMVTADGEVPITSIVPMASQSDAKTYNLRLEGGDSFYAGGVLVKDN